MHPCHRPPLYIDTRNAQKVSSILYFPKKLFRAVWNGDENFSRRGGFGRIPSLSFPRVRRAPCITARAPEPSVSPRGRQFLPPGRGCATPQTARAQAPLRRFPLLRQGPPAGRGGTTIHPCHRPLYIETRETPKKLHPFCIFSKKFFRTAVDEDKIFRVSVGWGWKRGEARGGALGKPERRAAGNGDKNGKEARGAPAGKAR